uniref:Conopeptide Mi005 n=1 Tax=Conus miles TaxID=69564 RepID=A0A0E3SVC8_CONMI|nr:conopeptide Mi005 [Conus miles]
MKLTCALIITLLFLSITAGDSRGKHRYNALKSMSREANSTERECREKGQGCTNTAFCCPGLECEGQSQGGLCVDN